MKKSGIAWVVATLLVLATCLSSCGVGNVSNVGKYLNRDYDVTPDRYTEAIELSELKGYEVRELSGGEFLLFTSSDTSIAGETTYSYKVFSMRNGKVIFSTEADEKTLVRVVPVDGAPALTVTRAKVDTSKVSLTSDSALGQLSDLARLITNVLSGDVSLEQALADSTLGAKVKDALDITYTLYDAVGNEVASSKNANDARAFADLVIYDYVSYTVNKTSGKLEKKAEIPEWTLLPANAKVMYNDTYYYVVNGNSHKTQVTVYDHDFNVCTTWMTPEYVDSEGVMTEWGLPDFMVYLLNNGDLLCQYALILPEDADHYDISYSYDGVIFKLDLVSKLISAKNGKEKDLDLDYMVAAVKTNQDLYDKDAEKEDNVFNNKFENIALVYYIENEKLVISNDKADIVLLNNKAKIEKSLKMVDHQVAEWANKVGDDLYEVETLDGGMALIRANGKVVHFFNNAMEVVGGTYLIGKRAVYDMDLEVVYDLVANDAEVEAVMNDVIFIRKPTTDGYQILALRNEAEEVIYTYTEGESGACVIEKENGYYLIVEKNGDHVYYNADGTVIKKTTDSLTKAAGNEEFGILIMKSVDAVSGKASYYAFR